MAEFWAQHRNDEDGMPSGGHVVGTGLTIVWQEGPLGRGDERQEPNGAFVETVIAACIARLRYYQDTAEGRFSCQENAEALAHLSLALQSLDTRTKRREARGIEGTHAEEATP